MDYNCLDYLDTPDSEMQNIESLTRDIRLLKNDIEKVYNSNGWKALSTYYLVRDTVLLRNTNLFKKLLPPTSWVKKVMKIALINTAEFIAVNTYFLANLIFRKHVSSSDLIIHDIEGNITPRTKKRLCIFAHYDRDQVIDDYVIILLKNLHDIDCEIIFVSTSESLRSEHAEKIKGFCSRIIIRKNVGYDFGSWKTGLEACHDTSHYEQIILTNDSVYGPLSDLPAIFSQMEKSNCDIWGLTDSFEKSYHLQSYFLVFQQKAFLSSYFRDFWKKFIFIEKTNKQFIINTYEVGLSRKALRAGMKLGVFCPYQTLVSHTLNHYPNYPYRNLIGCCSVNPSHFLWRV
ncbi:MAG: hypothetical protein H8D23_25000, partial [Candidatus Brocadiales bacterium]|nr:hypothetical protein [Candidatus Brocadiales bacterium]